MKCKVTRDLGAVQSWESPLVTVTADGRRIVAAGTVIDEAEYPEANCVALVRNGEGIPLDQECCDAVNMTPQQIDAAQNANARLYVGDATDDELEVDDEGEE